MSSTNIKIVARQLLIFSMLFWCGEAWASDNWLITAYCSCSKCCGKSDGITASGHHLKKGDKVVACNWLKFGTKVNVGGVVYSVEDRGAKSLFGSKTNHIKHLDIWMSSHKEALRYGKQYKQVEVIKQ